MENEKIAELQNRYDGKEKVLQRLSLTILKI